MKDKALKTHAAMLKSIRSWGFWLLGFGVLHLVLSGSLNAPWGMLLLVVGLASFFFQTASMFIVYAVTLAWAAVSNLTTLQPGWVVLALLQLGLSFQVFKQYRRFRDVEAAQLETATDDKAARTSADRAARFFPWLGSLFGCSSIIGLALVMFIALIVRIATGGSSSTPAGYWGFVEGLLVDLGVLGFAVGLASLLSRYHPKALAIIGLVAGILTLAIEVSLFFRFAGVAHLAPPEKWALVAGLLGLALYIVGLFLARARPEDGQAQSCPYCQRDVKPGADLCPHCGRDLPAPDESVMEGKDLVAAYNSGERDFTEANLEGPISSGSTCTRST